jgi:hypothetical protein
VQAPTKYGLAVDFKAVKGLGLTVPDKLFTLADEVIGQAADVSYWHFGDIARRWMNFRFRAVMHRTSPQ